MATQTPYNTFAGAAALANGVVWRNLGPLINFTRPLGNVWWVDSTIGSDSNSISSGRGNYPHRPFATVAHAIAVAVANNGDIIVVAPNHAETITAAGGWTVPAGVQIIGYQADGDRPQITFSTATTASILMSGANASIKGIIGIGGIASLANPFNVTAANCSLDIEWRDVTAKEAVTAVVATAGATNLNVNLKYKGLTGSAVNVSAIQLTGVKGARLNLDYYGSATTAVVNLTTTASTDLYITGTFNNTAGVTYSYILTDTIGGSTYAVNAFSVQLGEPVSWSSVDTNPADAPGWSYLSVVADLTSSTWNTAAFHRIAAISGAVEMSITPVITTALASSAHTISLGDTNSATSIASAQALSGFTTANMIWGTSGSAPAATNTSANGLGPLHLTNAGFNIGYTLSNSETQGKITFNIYWRPLAPNATVTAGTGGAS